MVISIPSSWIFYMGHKVGVKFLKTDVFDNQASSKVTRYVKAICPNGNMSMMGNYRRNAITFKQNIV